MAFLSIQMHGYRQGSFGRTGDQQGPPERTAKFQLRREPVRYLHNAVRCQHDVAVTSGEPCVSRRRDESSRR
jgi:hypothetical protein